MKHCLHLAVLLFSTFPMTSHAQSKRSTTVQKPSDCSGAFQQGLQIAHALDSDTLGKGSKFEVELVFEDILNSGAFKLAAAEILKEQFSDRIDVVPSSHFYLYLGGTNPMGEDKRPEAPQTYVLSLRYNSSRTVKLGNTAASIPATVVLANAYGSFQGGTQFKATKIKEEVYEVVSTFLKKWENANPRK